MHELTGKLNIEAVVRNGLRALVACLAFFTASGISQAAEIECETILFGGHIPEYSAVDNPAYRESQPDHLRRWRLIQKPIGGFIGSITVSDEAAAGGTARLRIYEVREEDLLPPAEVPTTPAWFEPMGIYNIRARRRTLLYEHTWDIASVPCDIPVILRENSKMLNRCIFEVEDRHGRVIYSCVPGEVYYNPHRARWRDFNAWVISDDETAHHRIASVTRIPNIKPLTEPPGDWDRFIDTAAIWIDEGTDIEPAVLRRIILSGGWIFGTREGLAPHLERLDMSPMPVLGGGMRPLEGDGDSAKGLFAYRYHTESRFRFAEQRSHLSERIVSAPMEDSELLFSRIRKPYLIFTFIVAGIYALGSVVLLPLLFIRLKGERRVELWWKTPLVLSVYTAVIVGAGWIFIQPRIPVSEVTEYRLGYGDWPEVFCNVNTAVLRYGADPVGWRHPASAALTYVEGDAEHVAWHKDGGRAGTLTYMNAVRGMQTLTGFGSVREMRQPFRVKMRGEKVVVSSERPLRNVHIALSGSKWLGLGDIPEGGEIEVPSATDGRRIFFPDTISRNAIEAADDRIAISSCEAVGEVCERCGRVHGSASDSLSVLNGTVFLIGVDEEDMPEVTGLHKNQDSRGRVAWISQVPVEGFKGGTAGK